MIPRYQRILFWILAIASLAMVLFLLRGCEQAHERITALVDPNPIAPPTASTTEDITLYLANDTEASITTTQRPIALPQEPTARARVLLDHLLAEYALPDSDHPLQSGPAIQDVFLLDATPTNPTDLSSTDTKSTGQLAIINLTDSFVANHPSGILVETLTLQSIIGTLHTAFPDITRIRFLVNGNPHDTLAGHADLLRTYQAVDTTFTPEPPTATQPPPTPPPTPKLVTPKPVQPSLNQPSSTHPSSAQPRPTQPSPTQK